jgi:hypothetical protein
MLLQVDTACKKINVRRQMNQEISTEVFVVVSDVNKDDFQEKVKLVKNLLNCPPTQQKKIED